MIEVRFAGRSDLPMLCEIARAFILESAWAVDYDRDAAMMRFESAIADEYMDVLVVTEEARIAGGAIVAIDRDFSKQWWGYFSKFYILKEYRRADIALPLVRMCDKWFESRGCSLVFATATSGIEGGFEIMMRRVGYRDVGATFAREISDGEVQPETGHATDPPT